jgi:hypothetical protein
VSSEYTGVSDKGLLRDKTLLVYHVVSILYLSGVRIGISVRVGVRVKSRIDILPD